MYYDLFCLSKKLLNSFLKNIFSLFNFLKLSVPYIYASNGKICLFSVTVSQDIKTVKTVATFGYPKLDFRYLAKEKAPTAVAWCD